MTEDYEDYPPGDPAGLPVIGGAVEVHLRSLWVPTTLSPVLNCCFSVTV
ncbi:hypothetical protein ACWGCW_19045 [Streptomyces sp. NPDC054933]